MNRNRERHTYQKPDSESHFSTLRTEALECAPDHDCCIANISTLTAVYDKQMKVHSHSPAISANKRQTIQLYISTSQSASIWANYTLMFFQLRRRTETGKKSDGVYQMQTYFRAHVSEKP